jgi:hypothetical protein
MLKPENNPYSCQYKGPPMCDCCDTVPTVPGKAFCTSCSHLTVEERHRIRFNRSSTAGSPPASISALSSSVGPSAPLGVNKSRVAAAVLAGISPTLHLDPSPCPSPPRAASEAPLSALAEARATDANSTWRPPYYEIEVSVFNLLNHFQKWWFLSWDHILKHVMGAQKAPNGHTFTWVKFTPQFHSYLIHSVLWLVSQCYYMESPRPPPGLVKKVKKVLFMFILELLLEEPHAGFFDLCPMPIKVLKTKK